MSDSSSGRIEIHALLLRKLLNLLVLLEVRLTLVLHVMVESHNNLLRVVDLACTNGHELQRNRPGIVMGHAVVRGESNVISRLHNLAICEAEGVSLYNLLGQGLWDTGGSFEGGKDRGGGRIDGLGVEDILETLRSGSEGS